jgi:hypothetical protein
MSESCEFLITQWEKGDQVNAGKITLKDGKLTLHPSKGHENALEEIRKTKSYIKDREFDPDKDPEGWLKSLPHQYSGSVLRARLIKDDDESES